MIESLNVDQVLERFKKCFESVYLNYKNITCPYDEVLR